jgi:hypothetical protein
MYHREIRPTFDITPSKMEKTMRRMIRHSRIFHRRIEMKKILDEISKK